MRSRAIRAALVLALFFFFFIAASSFAAPATVSLAAAGDIMLARGVASLMRREGAGAPFRSLAPLLRGQDLAFCNLETVISSRGNPRANAVHYRCPPDSAHGLAGSGFNLFSLANSHINDFGSRGMLDTRDFLAARGLRSAGAAENAWEALEPALVEKNGVRVALLAFRQAPFRARKPRDPQVASPDSAGLVQAVSAAKSKSDVVLVSYQWSQGAGNTPSAPQVRLARISIDAGADLVIGDRPRSLQAVEKYRGKYIFHSLGSCISDATSRISGEAALLTCRLSKGAVSDLALRPLVVRAGRPEPASEADFQRISARLRTYCATTGVKLTIRDSLLHIE